MNELPYPCVRPLPIDSVVQLTGRPVPDVCRHLGLTTGALSSAYTAATPATATVNAATAARTRQRAPPLPPPRSEGCSSRKRRKHRDGRAPGGINGVGVSACGGCADSRVPSAAATAAVAMACVPPTSSGAARDGASAAGRSESGGVQAGRGRPAARSAVLLPRRRIFYSSAFVRFGTRRRAVCDPKFVACVAVTVNLRRTL